MIQVYQVSMLYTFLTQCYVNYISIKLREKSEPLGKKKKKPSVNLCFLCYFKK